MCKHKDVVGSPLFERHVAADREQFLNIAKAELSDHKWGQQIRLELEPRIH